MPLQGKTLAKHNLPVLHLVEDAEKAFFQKLRMYVPPFFPNDRESIMDSCRAFQDRLRALRIDTKEIERRRLKVLCSAYDSQTAIRIDIELTGDDANADPPSGIATVAEDGPIDKTIGALRELQELTEPHGLLAAKKRAREQIAFEQEYERLKSVASVPDSPGPSAEHKLDKHPCKHKNEVNAFLQQCNQLSATRIWKKHIWLLVGHSKGRQFEYWQACNDKKATAEDRTNFSRVIKMKPEQFLAALRQKHLIPPA